MSLILSGTDGLSDIDGTAATPAIRGTDANTGIFFPAADTIAFSEGGVEAMRIDASGNVGIGVTPSYRLEVKGPAATAGQLSIHDGTGDTVVSGTNAASLLFQCRDSSVRTLAEIDGIHTTTNGTGGAMVFQTRISDVLAERMRIDSSGFVGINNTNPSWLLTASNTGTSPRIAVEQTADVSADMITFRRNGSERGKINITDSATQYQTSSDYRLKENITALTNGLETVAKLKPSSFTWVQERGGQQDTGFIAHELAEVCPNAVTGEKDAVDANGKPVYQGIDTSFLVATLTAAIQEQQALITALTARITALETPAPTIGTQA